ncbi:MAG: S8 family serine peptidase [Phycisphaerae bacterium]|nr:S8 family serine peptidase [Phycisphaerae bacterium]
MSNGPDAMNPGGGVPASDGGNYIDLNGKRLRLEKHPTDFTVIAPSSRLPEAVRRSDLPTERMSDNLTRVTATDRDGMMHQVRRERVVHHVYLVPETGDEILIDDRIFLHLRNEDPDELEAILRDYHLVAEGRMGDTHVLRLTDATGRNPLKTANAIALRDGVESCSPQVLVPVEMHQPFPADLPVFFRRQWYLSGDMMTHSDLAPDAGIDALEAWQTTTGDPDVVIAVIDDGFDLGHPAFHDVRIHPAKLDFVPMGDDDPSAERTDYHGTCVASIALSSIRGPGMVGVAPGCTFLPIRITFGPLARQVDMLDVFRYASRYADVVNCSFGTPPMPFDVLDPGFRQELTRLTLHGGRRAKGLIIVMSAGNDDAPTLLRGKDNKSGVAFYSDGGIRVLPPGTDVYSGYPLTRGVIVVGAMSSLKRKSGYSNWGPHITVVAPSNNTHYIQRFVGPGVNDEIRNRFLANYRGLGQIAASNRPGHGQRFLPYRDDPTTLSFREDFYTESFGGTSGASPVVTGTVALMLSVNPDLTAEEVRQILMATADRDLDIRLDLENDPNLQGLSGEFVNGRSLLFGSGKVNARRAVARAIALAQATRPAEEIAMAGERMRIREAMPPMPARGLQMETFEWGEGRLVDSRLRYWDLGEAPERPAALGAARLWLLDRDGTVQREYAMDPTASESRDPRPGTFVLRTITYTDAKRQRHYRTELAVCDPTIVERPDIARVALLRSPPTPTPTPEAESLATARESAAGEQRLLQRISREPTLPG